MHGVAYTVFEGTKPEAVDVEILGILRDMAGPKSDVILARLHGAKVEFTGVVAGMSGSPVYIDGKLVGAIAYRIGDVLERTDCRNHSGRGDARDRRIRQDAAVRSRRREKPRPSQAQAARRARRSRQTRRPARYTPIC